MFFWQTYWFFPHQAIVLLASSRWSWFLNFSFFFCLNSLKLVLIGSALSPICFIARSLSSQESIGSKIWSNVLVCFTGLVSWGAGIHYNWSTVDMTLNPYEPAEIQQNKLGLLLQKSKHSPVNLRLFSSNSHPIVVTARGFQSPLQFQQLTLIAVSRSAGLLSSHGCYQCSGVSN